MRLVSGLVLQHVVARGISAIGAPFARNADEVVRAAQHRQALTILIQGLFRFALVAQQGLHRPTLIEYLVLTLFEERPKIIQHLGTSLLSELCQLALGEVDGRH